MVPSGKIGVSRDFSPASEKPRKRHFFNPNRCEAIRKQHSFVPDGIGEKCDFLEKKRWYHQEKSVFLEISLLPRKNRVRDIFSTQIDVRPSGNSTASFRTASGKNVIFWEKNDGTIRKNRCFSRFLSCLGKTA